MSGNRGETIVAAVTVEEIPPITREEAGQLAAMEYTRFADLLRSLSPDDWLRPTDCSLWDVRAVAGHSVGMMADFTSFRSLMRRMRSATKASKQSGGAFIDEMTAQQVEANAPYSTAELSARAAELGPRAARWRTKRHTLFRRMPLKEEVGGKPETWRMAYLLHVVLTRDPWMHRVDITRATGRDLALTPEHDGRIVADVVAEWARRHGRPFTLTLTGPAGGHYAAGSGTEPITLDAVEFCRILSGRATADSLLSQPVPF